MEFIQPTRPTPDRPTDTPQPVPRMSRTDVPRHAPTNARRRLSKRGLFFAIIALVVLVTVVVTLFTLTRHMTSKPVVPNYHTLLPKGKTIGELGGWQRYQPPQETAYYGYSDSIAGVAINVTEQPMPKDFVEDVPTKVADMARSFNATDQFSAGGTTVYYGSSTKGPQSVIFTKSNLLFLIQSEDSIKTADWTSYISSLQ